MRNRRRVRRLTAVVGGGVPVAVGWNSGQKTCVQRNVESVNLQQVMQWSAAEGDVDASQTTVVLVSEGKSI